MIQAFRNLKIEEIEAVNEYLESNPQYDRYDQPIEMDDLDMNGDGDIVYAYSWKTRAYTEEGHGIHHMVENYDEQYVTLLTKEQLENEVKSRKENNA